jgi:glycosyltransferase involved in cell wall biosynthesis
MRILHIVHQYPPDHVGGTERYTQTLAEAQARMDDDVAIFAPVPRAGDQPVETAVEAGGRVFRVPVGPRSSTAVFRSTFGHPALAAALEMVLDEVRPDIVHLQHLMGLPAGFAAQLTARRIPFVIALHDYWYGCANAQLLTNTDQTICAGPDARATNCGRCALARAGLPTAVAPTIAPIMRRRNRLLHEAFAAAALVIAPNDFVAGKVTGMGLPGERIVILPWGLALPADLPAIRQAATADWAADSAGPLHLGYVGSLARQKGLHVLIDAVNALPPDSVTLDIYGNPAVFPDYVRELEAQATHPGIHFRGLLARDEFWSRMAALDAFVLPTLWYEASPLTIDEAFAAGVPVIGSAIGALPMMIRDGVDGRLFRPGDTVALAGVLRELIALPEQVAALRAGIAPVKTMDAHAAEIRARYEQLLPEARPR